MLRGRVSSYSEEECEELLGGSRIVPSPPRCLARAVMLNQSSGLGCGAPRAAVSEEGHDCDFQVNLLGYYERVGVSPVRRRPQRRTSA